MNNNSGTVREEASAIGDRIEGNVKDAYGAVTGDTSTEREGEYQVAEGAQRQEQNRMLTGLFNDRESTEWAYNLLRNRGYTDDDINLMMADNTRDSWFANDEDADTELGSKALEGAGAGSAIGGTLGAVIGGIAAIGTNVLLPGLGLVVAGPLAAALAGAGTGGLTGGLVGALIGSGIPEDRAQIYEEGVRNGGVVVGVTPRNAEDADYFENEWKNYCGEQIYGIDRTTEESLENKESVKVKEINAWISELGKSPKNPLKIYENYTLNLSVGKQQPGNLLNSKDKLIPINDIPDDGLTTKWIITFRNISLFEVDSGSDVRISQLSNSDHWNAEFPLFIPKTGDSGIVQIGVTPLDLNNAELQICIFAEQKLYRQLTVELNVKDEEGNTVNSSAKQAPYPATKIKDDTVFSLADELHSNPSQPWTAPPGDELTISVLMDGIQASVAGAIVLESGEIIPVDPRFTRWYASKDRINPLVNQLRKEAKNFCDNSVLNKYLNDIDSIDIVDRLNNAAVQNAANDHSFAYDNNTGSQHLSVWNKDVISSDELRRLAVSGYRLYRSIFPRDSELRTWIDALPAGWRINLGWTQNSGVAFIPNIPWGMIYTRNPENEESINPMNFWGLRFRLNYTVYTPKVKTKSLGSDNKIYKAGCFFWGDQPDDDIVPETLWQQNQWRNWTNQTFVPASTVQDKMSDLRNFLKKPAPSPMRFLYFFCHCKTDDNNGLFLRFGNTNQLVDSIDLIDLGLEIIEDEPLVFINACSSTAGDSYNSNQLIEAFMADQGCRAFIGTEIDMPTTLASRFALVFSHFFLRRISTRKITAGEALYQSRLFLWHHYRNIGGIFYTFINEFDLYIDDPKDNMNSTNTGGNRVQHIYR